MIEKYKIPFVLNIWILIKYDIRVKCSHSFYRYPKHKSYKLNKKPEIEKILFFLFDIDFHTTKKS